jgi:hypothetical protein
MSTELELRSIYRGRPAGTFGEAAYRMRHWHWLRKVMVIVGTNDVTDLDISSRKFRLSRGIGFARRFESIQLDGYNPDRVEVTKRVSLYKHVSKQSTFDAATKSFEHAFWDLLTHRNAPASRNDMTLQQLLRAHDIVRLDPIDESHGATLGLIPESYYELVDFAQEQEATPYDLGLITKQPTLDSLQLLLLLYREAQDLALDGHTRALRRALEFTAESFAEANGYAGEQFDTWRYLLQTRMIRWNPTFQPSQEMLKRAQDILIGERGAIEKRKRRRGPSSPETYTRGRAERRWRRQIWARACQMSFAQPQMPGRPLQPCYAYADTALADWLVENRSLIARHDEQALELLMDGDPDVSDEQSRNPGNLTPLIMPDLLYRRRSRPRSDDMTWHLFGNHLPFDIILVKRKSDK